MKTLLGAMMGLAVLLAARGPVSSSVRIIYEPGEPDSALITDTETTAGEEAYQLKHFLCSIKQEGTRCINGKIVDTGEPT